MKSVGSNGPRVGRNNSAQSGASVRFQGFDEHNYEDDDTASVMQGFQHK